MVRGGAPLLPASPVLASSQLQPGSAPCSRLLPLQSPTFFLFPNLNYLDSIMEASFIFLLYRYYLFGMPSDQLTTVLLLTKPSSPQVIAIVSNAIICSAAAWNLPISQNAGFHSKMAVVPNKVVFLSHPQFQLSCILTPI
jgi:hypothetical protein